MAGLCPTCHLPSLPVPPLTTSHLCSVSSLSCSQSLFLSSSSSCCLFWLGRWCLWLSLSCFVIPIPKRDHYIGPGIISQCAPGSCRPLSSQKTGSSRIRWLPCPVSWQGSHVGLRGWVLSRLTGKGLQGTCGEHLGPVVGLLWLGFWGWQSSKPTYPSICPFLARHPSEGLGYSVKDPL